MKALGYFMIGLLFSALFFVAASLMGNGQAIVVFGAVGLVTLWIFIAAYLIN